MKPVHETTAKRALHAASIKIAARRPRAKPQRKASHVAERYEVCRCWRRLPNDYFTHKVDLIIDNKHWEVPTTPEARAFKSTLGVRYQMRTRSEGLLPQYTKPNPKRSRQFLGGSVTVCADIRQDRVVLWEYIPGRWDGEAAAGMYRGPIQQVFNRFGLMTGKPRILEDNDPTGYKSSKARVAKKELGIEIVSLPRSSPDLNPLEFFLWSDVERRLKQNAPRGRETLEAFKTRLRQVAMSTPRESVREALGDGMRKRIRAVFEARGGHIARD